MNKDLIETPRFNFFIGDEVFLKGEIVGFDVDENKFLTQFVHFIVLDYLWKILEIIILGGVRGNLADSIMLALICVYIAWILDKEE